MPYTLAYESLLESGRRDKRGGEACRFGYITKQYNIIFSSLLLLLFFVRVVIDSQRLLLLLMLCILSVNVIAIIRIVIRYLLRRVLREKL